MGLEEAPEQRMIGFDLDPALQLARYLVFVFDGFDNTRNAGASKTEKQHPLAWSQIARGDFGRFVNRDRCLPRPRPPCDEEMAACSKNVLLFFSQLHPQAPPVRQLRVVRPPLQAAGTGDRRCP